MTLFVLTDTSCLRHHHTLRGAITPSRLTTTIKIACEIFGSQSGVDEGSSIQGLTGSLDPEDEVMAHLRNLEDYLPIGTALGPSQKTFEFHRA